MIMMMHVMVIMMVIMMILPCNKDVDNDERQCQDCKDPTHWHCYENLHLPAFWNNDHSMVIIAVDDGDDMVYHNIKQINKS